MKKDVLITILGSQTDGKTTENSEVKTVGEYYLKNDKHFLMFEELTEDHETIKTTMKIGGQNITLVRNGVQSTRMVFEKGEMNLASYVTPFGDITLGVNTGELELEESENHLKARVVYGLDMNGEFVTTNTIQIEVRELES